MKKLLGMLFAGAYLCTTMHAMTEEKAAVITHTKEKRESKAPRHPQPVYTLSLATHARTADDVASIVKNHRGRRFNYHSFLFFLARQAYNLLNQAATERNTNQTLVQNTEELFTGCFYVYRHAVNQGINGQALAAQVSNRKTLKNQLNHAIQCMSPTIVDIMLTFYRLSGQNVVALLDELGSVTLIAGQAYALSNKEKILEDKEEDRRQQWKLQRCKAIIRLLIFKFGAAPIVHCKNRAIQAFINNISLRETLSQLSPIRQERLTLHLLSLPVLQNCMPTPLLNLIASFLYHRLPSSEMPDMPLVIYQGIPEIDQNVVDLDEDNDVENLGAFFDALQVL